MAANSKAATKNSFFLEDDLKSSERVGGCLLVIFFFFVVKNAMKKDLLVDTGFFSKAIPAQSDKTNDKF